MTDKTKDQEPIVEESAPQQEERAPGQAADTEVELEPKESPDTDKALREARRDAKKADRRTKRLEGELQRARQYRQRVPTQPPAGVDEQEQLRQEAMAYRQIQQERFVDETLSKLSLEKDDPRLDYFSPETFMASAAMAKEEDFQEREAELAEREEKLESLGDRLRAEMKEALDKEKRELRRSLGLDDVAKISAGGVTAQDDIGAIYAEYEEKLKPLRGKGWMKEVANLKSERDQKIDQLLKKRAQQQ